jgi:hypothetical protein
MRKDLFELAEKENIPMWQSAIAHWIEQHQGAKVSLLQLQQALDMPLVEVWFGWGCCILLRLISGMVRGSFIGMCGIFRLAINEIFCLLTFCLTIK